MRVLHVVPQLSARIGGPAVSVVESSLALRDLGIDTTIFSTDMTGAVSAKRQGRATPGDLPPGAETLDVRLFRAQPPRRLAFAPSMLRALDGAVPQHDVVHIHMLFTFPQFAAYRATRRHGVPYIVSPCGALDPHLRKRSRIVKAATEVAWQRGMLDGAAGLHFKTAAEAALVAPMGYRAPALVAPNGIDWAAFQALPALGGFREKHALGDAPVVLHLGRLSHKKGLDVLVDAFARVAGDRPEARLVLAGPDDEGLTTRLQAQADGLGVGRRLVFTGMLRGDEKLAALASATVWALPSHTENFGVAVVEAMAAGLPIVTTPHVNIAAAIEAEGAGVVLPLSAEAFAAEIGALLGDPSRRASMGGRAREFARRYDWSEVAPQLAQMYERVVRGRPLRTGKAIRNAA